MKALVAAGDFEHLTLRTDEDVSTFFRTLGEAATFSASVPQISTTVVEDLISTGNVRLIRDADLRRTIQSSHARVSTLLQRMALSEARIASDLYARLAAHLPPGFLSVEGEVALGGVDGSAVRDWTPALRREAERLRVIANYLRGVGDELQSYVEALEG